MIGIKQADIDDINWEFGLSGTTKAITHQELQATLKSDLQGVDVFVEPHYRGPSDPMLTQDVFYINVHLGEFQALQNRRRGARPRVLPHDANASLTHRQIIYKTDCERVAIEVSNEVQAIRNRWKVNIPMVGPRQHPMTPKLDIQALQHDAALRMLEGRIVEGTGLKNPFGGKSGYQLAKTKGLSRPTLQAIIQNLTP